MNKKQAHNLINNTLHQGFNRMKFLMFTKNLFKHFNFISQEPKNNYSEHINTLEYIGSYKDPQNNFIDVFIAKLRNSLALERTNKNLSDPIAATIKRLGHKAALVAYVSPNQNDWRLSLVEIELLRVKAKIYEEIHRNTFLVGENEECHTAQEQFVPIFENNGDPTLLDIETAFSKEKVTSDFYNKYRDLYIKLEQSLDEIINIDSKLNKEFEKKEINVVVFSKKLLGQIIFLYFLQKKGWLGVKEDKEWGTGSKHFLREMFEKKHVDYQNFFNDILEHLFYEALCVKYPNNFYKYFKCRIPFLNGGLFHPFKDYAWREIDIILPNELFSNSNGDGILDIFDRYNFTVKEDDSLDKEVAVDPEMLGKVFENLLPIKDRKIHGVYYTPRGIVQYMCQQSLINYLANELKGLIGKEDIEVFIKNQSLIKQKTSIAEVFPSKICEKATLIDEKLADIRICDPSVGSGAFLVEMMNEIINIRTSLMPLLNRKKQTQYNMKRQIIQNCLYGVDIDPAAVEIARLRLWLSLVVDTEANEDIEHLPNLDYKIVEANSLLSSNIIQDHSNILNILNEFKILFFNESDPIKKIKFREQICSFTKQLTNDKFNFTIHFSEVFKQKNGFDVIIANPPYIKEYENRQIFTQLKSSPYYQGKMDLWYMFLCQSIDLLKENGLLTFIAQNNWVTSYGASIMRNKIITDTRILSLIDFGNYKIFKAGIQTMVIVLQKSTFPRFYPFEYKKLLGNDLDKKDINALLNGDSMSKVESMKPNIDRIQFTNKFLTFNTPTVQLILDKISKSSNFYLDSKTEVAQGIVCPQECVIKKSQEILGDNFTIGEGIFILSTEEVEALKLSENEMQLIKPLYTTREINGWHVNPINKKHIIYTNSDYQNIQKLEAYPKIKNHLDKFKTVITSSNKPYGLHRARVEGFFAGEKILVTRKCSRPTFTYVNFDSYVTGSFYIIKTNRINQKYLTGVLNSKLMLFWLKHQGKMQGTNYQLDKEPLLSLPLVDSSPDLQLKIANVVDSILTIATDKNIGKNITTQSKIDSYESEINYYVYKIYGLTTDEINKIEKDDF